MSTARPVPLIALLIALCAMCIPVQAHNYAAPALYMAGLFETEPYPVASDAEMAKLLTMLKSDDAEVRGMAASALGQTNNPKAVEPLLAALQDKANTVRVSAATGLAKLKDKRAIKPLMRMMSPTQASESEPGAEDYSPMVAMYALMAMGPEAIAEAKTQFQAEGQDELAKGMDELMLETTAVPVDEKDLPAQVQKAPAPDVNQVLQLLQSGSFEDVRRGVELASEVEDERVAEVLFGMITKPSENTPNPDFLAGALSGPNAVFVLDKLIALAKSKTDPRRQWAFLALRGQTDPRVIEVMLDALKDPKSRQSAVDAIGKGTDPRVMAAAIELFRTSAGPAADRFVYGFVSSDDPNAIQALVQAMKTGKPDIGEISVRILGGDEKPDPRFFEGFIALLRHKDPQIRNEALGVLAKYGDRRATKHILPLLNDPQCRVCAVGALGSLADPTALQPLIKQLGLPDPDPMRYPGEMRPVQALASYGTSATGAFIAALKSSNPKVRRDICQILQKTKDPQAVGVLIGMLKDSSPGVRAAAISALHEIGDAKAAEPIIRALKDPDLSVRRAAAGALATLRDPRAAGSFAALVKDKDPYVQACAGVALGLLGDARGADAVIRLLKQLAAGPYSYKGTLQYEFHSLWVPAIEAAGKLKDKRAVKPIVDCFSEDVAMSTFDGKSEEDMTKSRETKITALKQITGQDFGHAYYRWTAWAEYGK